MFPIQQMVDGGCAIISDLIMASSRDGSDWVCWLYQQLDCSFREWILLTVESTLVTQNFQFAAVIYFSTNCDPSSSQ